MRKRRPEAVSGGTVSTAILMPSQVVPQLRHTVRNSRLVIRAASHCPLTFPVFAIAADIGMMTILRDHKIDPLNPEINWH